MNCIAFVVLAYLAVVNAYWPKELQAKWEFLDKLGELETKVIGGRPATQNERPYQCSLRQKTIFGSSHICGGSLVNANWVLTAAHCCDGFSASQLNVAYGGNTRTSLPYNSDVDRSVIHPQWDSASISHDFCLLRLKNVIPPGESVQFVRFSSLYPPNEKENCIVSGWGRTGSSQTLPSALQVGLLDGLSRQECNDIWGSVNGVDDSMVCAMHTSTSGCNGDSGGPLTYNGEQVGVVSWGPNNCPPGTYPNVFAHVLKALNWIESTTAT